ncbi:MAG: hypothetical protein LKG27_02925 [Clostridiaceae bacterium]|jgi:flagellar assembly protein FliH|nr:hypothetical protein [Clostridiaceae bacterium]
MIIKKKIKKQDVTEEHIEPKESPESVDENSIDLFNLDNIDFKQRQERRRGDRRRGFRRVDDRNLISRAREEAVAIKEAAVKEGYQKGLADSKADIEELKNSLGVFLSAKQDVFDYIAPSILDISIDIAEKIIKKEVEQDPQIIINNITEILKSLSKDESRITLKVNPIQVDLLKQEMPEVMGSMGLDAKVNVIPDETVLEGGCMVTTTNGIIDATLETQLSIISEALREI